MVSSKVDEPRDEEEKDQGLLNRLHLRLHHRILGDVVNAYEGGRTHQPWGWRWGCWGRTTPGTRTMREQRNRDSNRGELRDTPRQICYRYTTPDTPLIRHARYATTRTYREGFCVKQLENCFKMKDGEWFVIYVCCSYSYPHGPLLYLY